MTDYCDTCKYLREQLSRQQAILNRLQQSGSALEAEVKVIETTKADLEEELKQHKITATKARDYYKTTIDRCRQQWNTISELTKICSPTRHEREEPQTTQHLSSAQSKLSNQGRHITCRRYLTTSLELSFIVKRNQPLTFLMRELVQRTPTTPFLF